MIHVLTPLRKDEPLAYDVAKQTIQCQRFTNSCDLPNRRENEAYNRNALKSMASSPYTVLMDADVIPPDDAFEKMAAFLDKHPFPAVAVDTKGMDGFQLARATDVGHTVIALLMIRSTMLQSIIFGPLTVTYNHPDLASEVYLRRPPEANECLCTQTNEQVRGMYGYQIPYLKGVWATESGAK